MISIVLPTYNGEKYLASSIDSILAQTYTNFELILVDDCSTDATPKICDFYAQKDPRIQVIHNEKNSKTPYSLNRGFAVSKGEYLTWTSDDNLYEKNALEVLLREISQGYDFVYTDYIAIDAMGNILPSKRKKPLPSRLWRECCIGACFLYRRKIYETIGEYDENMFLIEDYDYWLRIAIAGFTLHYCPERPYRYRFHAGALTAKKLMQIRKKVIKMLENILKNSNIPHEGRIEMSISLMKYYADENQIEKFRQLFHQLRNEGIWPIKYLTGGRIFKYYFGVSPHDLLRKLRS